MKIVVGCKQFMYALGLFTSLAMGNFIGCSGKSSQPASSKPLQIESQNKISGTTPVPPGSGGLVTPPVGFKKKWTADFGPEIHESGKEGFQYLWKYSLDPEFKIELQGDGHTKNLMWKDPESEEWLLVDEIQTLPPGKRFFRWSAESFTHQIEPHQYVPADFLDMKVNEIADNYHGGGVYMSSNAFDSQSYGNELTVSELEFSVETVRSIKLQKVVKPLALEIKEIESLPNKTPTEKYYKAYNSICRSLRMLGIHGIETFSKGGRYAGSTHLFEGTQKLSSERWYNFIRPEALSHVSLAIESPVLHGCNESIVKIIRGEKVPAPERAQLEKSCDPAKVFETLLLNTNEDKKLFEYSVVLSLVKNYPEWAHEAFTLKLNEHGLKKTEIEVLHEKAALAGISLPEVH